MNVINLTPHEINIYDGDAMRILKPTPPAARVSSKEIPVGVWDGIKLSQTVFGDVENLPEKRTDTILIVSQIVIQACPDRDDLFRPDTGPSCVRDEAGKIVAVRGLTR